MANLNSKSRYNGSYLNVVPPYFGADGKKYDNYFDMVAANARFAQQEIQNELLQEQNELLKEQNELAKKQQKEIEEQKRKELEAIREQESRDNKLQIINAIKEYHSISLNNLIKDLGSCESKLIKSKEPEEEQEELINQIKEIRNQISYHSCVLVLVQYEDIDEVISEYRRNYFSYNEKEDYEKQYNLSITLFKGKIRREQKRAQILKEVKPQLDKLNASYKRLLRKKYYNELKIAYYEDKDKYDDYKNRTSDLNYEIIEKVISKIELEDKISVYDNLHEDLEKFRYNWLKVLFFAFLPLLPLCEIVSYWFLLAYVILIITCYISISIKENTSKNKLSKDQVTKLEKLKEQLPEINEKLIKIEKELDNLRVYGSKTKPKEKVTKAPILFKRIDGSDEENEEDNVIEPDEDEEPIIDETLEPDEDYDKFIDEIDKDELEELNEEDDDEYDNKHKDIPTIILHREGED